MLDQALRKQYLKTLGIQLWVPRVELPGAKKSCGGVDMAEHALEYPEELVASAAMPQNAIANQLPANAQLPDLQQVAEDRQSVLEKPSVSAAMATVFYTGQCLVIAQLAENETQLSASCGRLLTELLHSLGVDVSPKPRVDRLNAPPQISLGADSPSGLDSLLQSLQLKQPGRFVLLLGEGPHSLLNISPSDYSSSCGNLMRCGEQRIAVTLALTQMLDDPNLKGLVWRHLQSLRHWLTDNGE